MLQAVAKAHSVEVHDLHVTASIGVTVYPDDGMDSETLIDQERGCRYVSSQGKWAAELSVL
jgi:GGDEF domain-containing protein